MNILKHGGMVQYKTKRYEVEATVLLLGDAWDFLPSQDQCLLLCKETGLTLAADLSELARVPEWMINNRSRKSEAGNG